MLKLRTDQKREPFGGHQYHEYGMTFKGASFDAVVADLKSFRINNNIPLGSPEQDVLLHYAKHWPFLVREDREASAKQENDDYDLWRKWIYFTWKKAPKRFLTAKEAELRWEACTKCVHNHKIVPSSKEEFDELGRRLFLLKRGCGTPKELGYCSLHKCDIGLFSLIDNPVDYTDNKTHNQECWLKTHS